MHAHTGALECVSVCLTGPLHSLQDLVSCQSDSSSPASFLCDHAQFLLPSLLCKQTAARVVTTQHSQSMPLHNPQGREEYLEARQLLKASLQEMKDYAEITGAVVLTHPHSRPDLLVSLTLKFLLGNSLIAQEKEDWKHCS